MVKFKLVVADPPWPFGDKLPGYNRGAASNYSLMSIGELCGFPWSEVVSKTGGLRVAELLERDCVLAMWRVASMQQEALDVVRMWGFQLKTEIVWLKKTEHGKRWFGMGRTVRAEHETCLIATRGRPAVKNHYTRSTFVTDVTGLSARAGEHSEKPEEFYKILEELFEGPYLELFARRRREGWTCIGNELI